MYISGKGENKIAILTSPQELAFGIGHGFDHVFTIAGVEEELTTLSIRDEFYEISVTTN